MDKLNFKFIQFNGIAIFLLLIIILLVTGVCSHKRQTTLTKSNVRGLVDTVGFAHYPWQMDSIMARIDREGWKKSNGISWRLAICPHDDYTYVGKLYPEVLQNIKAKILILIGVAHKAAKIGIEDSLVFDSFSAWKGPWNDVPVNPVREEIFNHLQGRFAIKSDTLQKVEHSIEAMIPYLQYFNRDISIVPVLVPAMSEERMDQCAKAFAEALRDVAEKHKWKWGRDFAVVVTTDAVHYGNEDWGGADMAFFGCDSTGNQKALDHEKGIIDSCLIGGVIPEKVHLFRSFTLKPDNYRQYKWTWCGRYSVPFALLASWYLNNSKPLEGELIGYSTSITSRHINVDDLIMGRTAIATNCHWVGYAGIGYR
jgi:AmmeMemoRadiSam system protein B